MLKLSTILRAGLVAATLIVTTSAASTSAAGCATPAPTTAEGWQDLVTDTSFNGRWYHGDAGRSLRLPDGRHIWIFGDTMSGKVAPDGTQQHGDQFIHNRAVITDKGCVTQLIGPNRADGHPTDWIPITRGNDLPGVDDYYWPSGMYMDGAYLRVFLNHVGGGANYTSHGVDVATFDVSRSTPRLVSISRTPGATAQDPAWGSAVIDSGLYTYIYGSINKSEPWVWGHYHYLARVPRGTVTNKNNWRYWNGSTWSSQQSQAIPVISGHQGIGAGTVIFPRANGGYALVAKQYEYVGSEIVTFTSNSLTGPWTMQTPAALSPIPDVQSNEVTYSAFAHPGIQLASGKLLISWALGSTDSGQFGSPRPGLRFGEVDIPQ